MRNFSKIRHRLFIIIGIIFIFSHSASGNQIQDPNRPIAVTTWLQTNTVEQALPAFNNIKNLDGKTFELKDLLEFEHVAIDSMQPKEGDKLLWQNRLELQWHNVIADSNDLISFESQKSDSPQIVYMATYFQIKRWVKTKITINSSHLFKVYLDGSSLTEKNGANKLDKNSSSKPGNVSKEIKLEKGTHILLVKALKDPKNSTPWGISTTINLNKDFKEDDLKITTTPQYHLDFKHLLNTAQITDVSISSDSEFAALILKKQYSKDKSQTWLEIYKTKDAGLYHTFRGGMKISNIQWAPVGRKFAYTTNNDDLHTLWVVDLDTKKTKLLLEDIKNLSSYLWSPDSSFIVYSTIQKSEQKGGLKLLKGMEDRQPTYRDRSFLYKVSIEEGIKQRLTSGLYSTDLQSISNESDRLIFSRTKPDYTERPYSKTDFFVLNTANIKTSKLFTSKWSGSVTWSPKDDKLLIIAGPSFFEEIGENVPEGVIPNDYDSQAYIYNLKTENIDPITKAFDPEISQAFWHNNNNIIYFKTIDQVYINLYKCNPDTKKFKKIDTGVDVIQKLDIARNKPVAVYTGASVTTPTKSYVMDLETKERKLLVNPAKKDFKNVSFGNIERWTFINKRDTEIEGLVYYPPDFDHKKTYPCIVYYYGGTFPTPRGFGGSYSKNLWAAKGYIVYVLQPSGAIGFGQKFSALHVNDWGIIVADEIIEGVKKFVAAHPSVDAERVGCIGASYGGFMTMLLQTRTDIFAAAISHAGISSISSYWGEGYWGYSYSAVAAANSFPWNRKDIFIEQSPLFNADKIKTPLLLFHGSKDTNVPPGESIQLYTALKLLGKNVELIEVTDEDHGVTDYNKRLLWMKSTLAWFDKYLKNQPQWWNDLYKK